MQIFVVETRHKFGPKVPIKDKSVMIQVMALCRTGDNPFSEQIMTKILWHISPRLNEFIGENFRQMSGMRNMSLVKEHGRLVYVLLGHYYHGLMGSKWPHRCD